MSFENMLYDSSHGVSAENSALHADWIGDEARPSMKIGADLSIQAVDKAKAAPGLVFELPEKRYENPDLWLADLQSSSRKEIALENFEKVPVEQRTDTLMKAWDLQLGSKDRQRLLPLEDVIPNEDRNNLHRKILLTKDFVGAIPESLLPGTVGQEISSSNWTALFKLNEHSKNNDKNASSLEHADNLGATLILLLGYIEPVDDRGEAWIQMASNTGRESEKALAVELVTLTDDDRTKAYWHAFEHFGHDQLPTIVRATTPEVVLPTLKILLEMPAGDSRAETLKNIPLPDSVSDLQEIIQLCLSKCTDKELASMDFAQKLSPDINKFGGNGSEFTFGFDNLPAKLNQDSLYSKLSYNDFLKLGYGEKPENIKAQLDNVSLAAQDVYFRFANQMQSQSQASNLLNEISALLAGKSASQLALDAVKMEAATSDSDLSQSLREDVVVRAARDLNHLQTEKLLTDLGNEIARQVTPTPWNVSFAASIAFRIASHGTGTVDAGLWKNFVKPIQDALNDPNLRLAAREKLGEQVGLVDRMSSFGEPHQALLDDVVLPSIKMKPRFENLKKNGATQAQLRAHLEDALFDNDKLSRLLGDGELGKIFPDVFGKSKDTHAAFADKAAEARLFRELNYVRQNPEFKTLNRYDQTNLLLATFLQDVSINPEHFDPDQSRISAGWADGIMTTLAFAPEDVSRVSALISRHSELSLKNSNGTTLDISTQSRISELSVLYSNPAAVEQLRIMNEADLRASSTKERLWTPETKAYLDKLSETTSAKVADLNKYRLPILTSSLPRKFEIVEPESQFAFYAHSSSEMNGKFWDQMASIESQNTDLSASLIRNGFGSKIYSQSNIVAILSAPQENVAAAYHGNLLTGHSVNWPGHVALVNKWAKEPRAREIADEVAGGIKKHGLDTPDSSATDTATLLDRARREAAKYNSLDELIADQGKLSFLYKTEQEIQKAMTTNADGSELTEFDEVKINNPVVSGLGIFRRGRPVYFEDLNNQNKLQATFGTTNLPNWLSTAKGSSGDAIMIPKRVWSEAQKKHIPFVILD